MTNSPSDVTVLLEAISSGQDDAWEPLLERIHGELKTLAHRACVNERPGHLLQTTALVNEAYLRLVGDSTERWRNQSHFFTAAASAMRRVLVDEARRRHALKRGGARAAVRLTDLADSAPDLLRTDDHELDDVEAVNNALQKLESDRDLRPKRRVVELRFFVGLTIEETARVLGISPATVKRDWDFARAWLRREVERSTAGDQRGRESLS